MSLSLRGEVYRVERKTAGYGDTKRTIGSTVFVDWNEAIDPTDQLEGFELKFDIPKAAGTPPAVGETVTITIE